MNIPDCEYETSIQLAQERQFEHCNSGHGREEKISVFDQDLRIHYRLQINQIFTVKKRTKLKTYMSFDIFRNRSTKKG